MNLMLPLAAVPLPEIFAAILVPSSFTVIVLGIVYSRHQIKMAQIMYGQGGKKVASEVSELRAEVAQLKELMVSQALALELSRNRPVVPSSEEIEQPVR